MSVCKSCRAAIVWLPSPEGRAIPVNHETVRPQDTFYDRNAGHISHFATCPQSKFWKGKCRKTRKEKPHD